MSSTSTAYFYPCFSDNGPYFRDPGRRVIIMLLVMSHILVAGCLIRDTWIGVVGPGGLHTDLGVHACVSRVKDFL